MENTLQILIRTFQHEYRVLARVVRFFPPLVMPSKTFGLQSGMLIKATVKSFFQKKSEFFFLHHIMQLSMTFPKN